MPDEAPPKDWRRFVRTHAGTRDSRLPFKILPSRYVGDVRAPFVASGPGRRCIYVGAGWLAVHGVPEAALADEE